MDPGGPKNNGFYVSGTLLGGLKWLRKHIRHLSNKIFYSCEAERTWMKTRLLSNSILKPFFQLCENHDLPDHHEIGKRGKVINIGRLTRELGVSGSVSERRAEGEVGRSDILGAAFSEKSATQFRSINEKNPPKKPIYQCREWCKAKHTVIMKEHGAREKKMRQN